MKDESANMMENSGNLISINRELRQIIERNQNQEYLKYLLVTAQSLEQELNK